MTSRTSLARRHRAAGFTLTELVVVGGILGIIAAIAVPAFQVVRLSTALSSAQSSVAAAVQNARWRAINSGTTHTVNLATASSITVVRSGTTVFSLSLGDNYVTQTHTGNDTFDFDSRGLIPSGTATPITITLTNPRGATRTVAVDRLGRITTS
jgi:type IV fimbrial biogenesis protein FimT